jgi:DNA-binding XRE family transcriptional regulator
MEATEFRDLRESFGLSVSWLARNAKIAEAAILAWEKGGRIPPNAAEKMLTEISNSMEQFEQELFFILKMTENIKKKVLTVVLPRFTCSEDLWKYIPEFDPLPLATYNILLECANKRLLLKGQK